MKEELIRLIKDGEFKFYNGVRVANREKAIRLVKKAEDNGYEGYSIYANSFGYIVKI